MDEENKTTEIAEYDKARASLVTLRERYAATVWIIENGKQLRAAKEARAEVKKPRLALDVARKETKASALARCRLVDSEAKDLRKQFLAIETPIDEAIKADEKRRREERERKEEEEAARVAQAQADIEAIRNVTHGLLLGDSTEIRDAIERLAATDVTRQDEFADAAEVMKDATLNKLREMQDAAIAHEEEQARIVAERTELAELRAEAEEREKEERARVAAEKEARDQEIAAEEKVRAHEEKEARAKIAAEEKAARERIAADEEKRREEARAMRAKIDAEQKAAMESLAELQRAATVKRESDDAEAREARDKADAEARQTRLAEEKRADEKRVAADAIAHQASVAEAKRLREEQAKIDAEREAIEEEKRGRQAMEDQLLDAQSMLRTFADRFGGVSEFVGVVAAIDEYFEALRTKDIIDSADGRAINVG